jgi:putative CocE/NonD family hydrolase
MKDDVMNDRSPAHPDIPHSDVMVPARNPDDVDYPGVRQGRDVCDGIAIDHDLAVPMGDGSVIRADLYRDSEATTALPTLLLWSPYGKHGPVTWAMFEGSEVDVDRLSPMTLLECPDPAVWCRRGYALVAVDPRGTWGSDGDFTIQSPQERQDMYETVEWIAEQPWCDGNVGMAGMSYFSWSQWQAASMVPPHLKAIQPYDGATDAYRELAFHGGIPNDQFIGMWNYGKTMWGRQRTEDWRLALDRHPLLDEFWRSKQPDLEAIDIPAYVVASWTDHGIHTRGTLEGFKRMGSQSKYLEVHGQKKWSRYYWAESVERQMAFFDRYLKGTPNEVDTWPRVRIEVREGGTNGAWRDEQEWPLARTDYVAYYLDAATATLHHEPRPREAEMHYSATAPDDCAVFELTVTADLEITGHAMVKLWISLDEADDADLFVALQKIDASGHVVNFPYFTLQNDGQMTHGWQRLSHREIEESTRQLAAQPVHAHTSETPVPPGQIVDVSIELWPSSTVLHRGERLRLLIQGSDIQSYPDGTFVAGHRRTRNAGNHILHTGGCYDAHVLLPVIPADTAGAD